jgi:hypothetical protein
VGYDCSPYLRPARSGSRAWHSKTARSACAGQCPRSVEHFYSDRKRPICLRSSWPGLSGPLISARAAIGGPDTPGHDEKDWPDGRFQSGSKCHRIKGVLFPQSLAKPFLAVHRAEPPATPYPPQRFGQSFAPSRRDPDDVRPRRKLGRRGREGKGASPSHPPVLSDRSQPVRRKNPPLEFFLAPALYRCRAFPHTQDIPSDKHYLGKIFFRSDGHMVVDTLCH